MSRPKTTKREQVIALFRDGKNKKEIRAIVGCAEAYIDMIRRDLVWAGELSHVSQGRPKKEVRHA